MQDIPLTISFRGREMKGFAVPLVNSISDKPAAFDIIIDKAFMGTLRLQGGSWKMDTLQDPDLVQLIASTLTEWYQPAKGAWPTLYMSTSARTEI